MARPEVSTRQFEFSHGHKPRGIGYWAFAPEHSVNRHGGVDDAAQIFWFNGTYSDAKRAAQLHFNGRDCIVVLS